MSEFRIGQAVRVVDGDYRNADGVVKAIKDKLYLIGFSNTTAADEWIHKSLLSECLVTDAAVNSGCVEFKMGDTVNIIGGDCMGKQGVIIDRAHSPGFWQVRVIGEGDWILYRSVMMLAKEAKPALSLTEEVRRAGGVLHDELQIDPHSPGAKLDSDKPLAGVLLEFSRALEAVVDVGTFGANKYSRCGWLSVPDGEQRYADALMRHLLACQREVNDPDSGLPHLAHLAWNCLAVLELKLARESRNAAHHSV